MYAVLSTVNQRLDLTGQRHIKMPYKDPEKQKQRLRDARATNKQWAIDYKGVKCESCGLVPEYIDVFAPDRHTHLCICICKPVGDQAGRLVLTPTEVCLCRVRQVVGNGCIAG